MKLEPGLYKATVRGVPDQIVMIRAGTARSVDPIDGDHWHNETEFTAVRPLIVLDLVSSQVDYLRHALNRWIEWSSLTDEKRTLAGLLGQIEAQVKPPRIPEPHQGERVTAQLDMSARHEFLRIRCQNKEFQWVDLADGHVYMWSALKDPSRGGSPW